MSTGRRLIFLILLLAPSAHAADTAVPTVDFAFTLPHGDWFATSPDLQHLYVTTDHVMTLNVYQVLASRWLEVVGLLLALYTLWTLRRSIRTVRRRESIGEPHCRHCHYQLTGIESDRCPECGHDVTGRGRVIGTPVRRRLAFMFAVVAVLWIGWSVAERFAPPMFQTWSGPVVYADSLYEFADRHQLAWLTRLKIETSVVEDWNPVAGTLVRRVAQVTNLEIPYATEFSTDSRRVYLTCSDRVLEYDVASARLQRTLLPPAGCGSIGQSWPADDGSIQATATSNAVLRWDKGAGVVGRMIGTIPGEIYRPPGAPFYVVIADNHPITVRDLNGEEIRQLASDPKAKYDYSKIASLDGSRLFLSRERTAYNPESIVEVWDTISGQKVTEMNIGIVAEWMGCRADRLGLCMVSGKNWFDLWDARTAQKVRRIEVPEVNGIGRFTISPDNQRGLIMGSDLNASRRRVLMVSFHGAMDLPD